MKKKRKIRFFAGFIIAMALVIGVGGATYLTLHKQVEEQQMVQHTYKVLRQANYIGQVMIDMETGRRGFRCTNDKQFLEPYYRSQPKLASAVQDLALLVANNPGQAERVRQLGSSTQRLDSFWKSININTIYADQEEKKRVTLYEKTCMDVVRGNIAAIVAEEDELLAIRERDSGAGLRHTIVTLVVGDTLILIIVLSLIWLSISEYNTRTAAERRLYEKLDEVKKLNEETERTNWQLTGAREINSSLMGYDSLQMLIDRALEKIVDYTNVPAGAFYFYDKTKKQLLLRGRQGLPEVAQNSVALNEGITGRAAMRKELTLVRDIPAGYWQITSATGNAAPDAVLCLPLWLNNELKGIIELPVFGKDQKRIAHLLEQVADNISMAVEAAHANDNQQLLLAKVQEQKEELVSQQEELRQTNEELTHQADVLRASEEELKTQEEELRHTNVELELKTEAVEAASKELEMKARELEQSSKYKSQFLANMSHELRTPLNSVLILANILKQNKTNNLDAKQLEYARTIHKSGSDLLTLINDILDLTKIEVGKIDIFIDRVRIKDISRDMEQLFSAVAADSAITFVIDLPPGLPEYVDTDRQRLQQIVKNLLSNAFKFTPEQGTVTLSFERHDGRLSISVKDTGIGIPADKQKLIFEAFQQADGTTSRKYGGTGLGLAISRELAHRLHAEIFVSSEPGKGSTFTIVLPFDREPTPVPVSGSDATVERPEYDLADVKEQTVIADDRKKVKEGEQYILIIEDDLVFASVVNGYAHKRGYKTIVATKGDEGLLYAQKHPPLAIILDLGLPVIDGRSILKILKADDALKNIPVHVITAEDRVDIPNVPIDSFFHKPLKPDDLEQAFASIETYLKAHYKNILLLSHGNGSLTDMFDKLTREKNAGVIYYVAQDVAGARELIAEHTPDCIVVDISTDVVAGIDTLKQLKGVALQGTYMITCLEGDISQGDERQLKQYSDSIIRRSSLAADRLLDEVDLFLHKIKNTGKPRVPEQYSKMTDDMLKGKKVLLADDDMRNVFALSAALEEQGMEIITAEDGKVAMELINKHDDIDIVLMDLMMPELDGYEVIKQIRTIPRYARVPVIALTARTMIGDREKCIAAGASDYVTKPVDNGKLFSLIRVWLS